MNYVACHANTGCQTFYIFLAKIGILSIYLDPELVKLICQ